MRARRNARMASLALLGATLATGFLGGVVWRGDGEPAKVDERARRPDKEGRRLVIDGVGLDAETRAQVEDVIRHYRSRMRSLDRELREIYEPRRHALVREARDSIRSLLSAEQKMVYDSLLALRHSRRGGENRKRGADDDRGGT